MAISGVVSQLNLSEDRHMLTDVYRAGSVADLTAMYDDWARDYDRDVLSHGYLNPAVICGLAARHVPRKVGPVMDAGAGTGIAGEILMLLGYREIVAVDVSAQMLRAALEKGVYSGLCRMEFGKPLGFATGVFAALIAVCLFTIGHAPPGALDDLIRVTRSGGRIVFNVNAQAYESGGFAGKQAALEEDGRWKLLQATPPFAGVPLRSPPVQTIGFAYRLA